MLKIYPCIHLEPEDSSSSRCPESPENPHTIRALMNDVILRNIFRFLSVDDYKHCRLVCQKWKIIGESRFKKKIRVFFDFLKKSETRYDFFTSTYEVPDDLNEFFKIIQEDHPVVALKLCGPLPWSPSKLKRFFSTEGRFITDLTLQEVALANKFQDDIIESYNVSGLIADIMPNLKSLKIIDCHTAMKTDSTTAFTLALKDLSAISYIHLSGCTIEIEDSTFISPAELTLDYVSFSKNDTFVERLLLNDIINFNATNKLDVHLLGNRTLGRIPPEKLTDLELDLSGNIKMQEVTLSEVDIVNLEGSAWDIDTLNLWAIPFMEKNNMKIKKFLFSSCGCDYDLCVIPPSVEKLTIVDFSDEDIEDWEIQLPNIKCLELRGEEETESFFPYLTSFNNVVELELTCFGDTNVNVDINLIPRSVKILTVQCDKMTFVGEGVLELDKLIFKDSDLEFAMDTIPHFSPKYLILSDSSHNFHKKPVIHHIKLTELLRTEIPRIRLERFSWQYLKNLKFAFPLQNIPRSFIAEFNGQQIFPINLESLQKLRTLCSETKVYYDCILPNGEGTHSIAVNGQTIRF